MSRKLCDVNGCQKPARSKTAELCPMHYHRQYRGKPIGGPAEHKRSRLNEQCEMPGCDKPDSGAGLCSMHYARKRRHGDPRQVVTPADRDYPTGESHHRWTGHSAGYSAAHGRVRRARGSARSHACDDCGQQAHHWSYNHLDPDELLYEYSPGKFAAYSTSMEFYQPRCVPCHKRFDLDRETSMRPAA